jgi:hypothetical protein
LLGSGAWRAGAGLVEGGDETGEQMGEGLALLVGPAADRAGELGAPVVMTRQRVRQTRDLLLRGVSADQYGTLAQMAANLQASAG